MNRFRPWPALLALAAFAACDGSSRTGQLDQDGARVSLVSVEVGRLVDVYSFRRIDPSVGDRRLRANRRLELVASNVVVNSRIESERLFDASGNASATADFEFLPFDSNAGHEQLLILWDDRDGPEKADFDRALAEAQSGLDQLPPSYRGQNTQNRPIPLVPRNAAFRLNFTGRVNVGDGAFQANPALVQLLEFKGDPAVVSPVNAFRILPYRAIAKDRSIILDTTILGGEAAGGITSSGMPESVDSVTANIRIAIPTRGQVLPSFFVNADGVNELNGADSAGRNAVIRDFRSGNLLDGPAGRLPEFEPPHIVGPLSMGITEIDSANNLITVNKRLRFVPIRARYPFVDGPLDSNEIPLGPDSVPVQRRLTYGDIISQDITVQLENGSFETVHVRAEVLENLSIEAEAGQGVGTAPNAPSGDSGQGETLPVVQLRVATVSPARDSDGNPVSFRASSTPAGEECTVRAIYVDQIAFKQGSAEMSDRAWRNLFVKIEPTPGAAGVDVAPNASLAIEFTKPMDLEQVDPTSNLVVTSVASSVESFDVQLGDPKRATARVVPTRLTDLTGDGTVLRLQPPLGFAHEAGVSEIYSLHVRAGEIGVTDLAGNELDLYDDISAPLAAWSVDFQLDAAADSNLIGWKVYRFEAEDEDGTLPGSVDMFGQFRLENGRLFGASSVRFSRSANASNLSTISRITRGECWDTGDFGTAVTTGALVQPAPNPPAGVVPISGSGAVHPGLLYWEPQMSDQVFQPNVPQVFIPNTVQPTGRVIEPLKPQGSRMQMRYIEDDFSLSYTQPSEFGLDVEQLYWSPFNDETILYDEFDRFTMSLGHARTRPDELWTLFIEEPMMPPNVAWCVLDCASMNSGLSTVFADNVLEGTQMMTVFEDAIYTINPNEAQKDATNVTYVPFPRFDRSYTWRDSRLVTVDATGEVIGLGGAQNPDGSAPNDDRTANIDSPWVTSNPDPDFVAAGWSTWTQDPADFRGALQRDHDPIALPLLVDMKVFPEDASNGVAAGQNGFQMALLGPPTNFIAGDPGGYYDAVPSGCGAYPRWPRLRVHASGGFDLITGNEVLVDPSNVLTANATNVIKDAAAVFYGGSLQTGLFAAPSGDGMLNWSRADFVRRVSTVTFGFFDSLQPQRSQFVDQNQAIQSDDGFPNWLAVNPLLRMTDVAVQLDPPQTRQPAGTGVVVELRGCETFENSGVLYDPIFGPNATDDFDLRGNLLNANYACEAYRYSTANVAALPRIAADGLTRYVTEDQVDLLRDPATDLLPRFLNIRLAMRNNVDVTPTLSPSLRSMSVVYRLQTEQ